MRTSTFYFVLISIFFTSTFLNANEMTCEVTNTNCIQSMINTETQNISEPRWKNQAYRNLAVSTAFSGNLDTAISYILKIDNSDTQAMTIRAIGMALAIHKDLEDVEYKNIFKKLENASLEIKDEGARDIAYTYIAMAQAFAGLDTDATATTDNMKNPALKHKAFGETAEIQAERGDYDASIKSINAIKSMSFKNKALGIVSSIFLKSGDITHAYKCAVAITNPMKKVKSLQNIVNHKIGLGKSK